MVIRVNKTSDYTVMSNSHFKELDMSLKAKGLLSLMLSLPDEWDYSISGLCAICKENETAIRGALQELEKYGYLKRTRITVNGRFEYNYDIFETPHTEKQHSELPHAEKPYAENPHTENQAQVNTYKSNTNRSNTEELSTEEEIPPTAAASGKCSAILTAAQQIMFNSFWTAYPRKVAKAGAERAWAKIKPDAGLTTAIIAGVKEAIKKDCRFRETRFTPHPATWLNGREWENTYEETAGGTSNAGQYRDGFRTDF